MIQKIFALLILIVLSPLLTIVSALILFFDGRPIFYNQKRIGKNNKTFNMLKFRTMLNGVGDIPTSNVVDPSLMLTVTGKKIRKYSIDELPQLINVVMGNMKLIGYRPCLPNENDLIESRKKYKLEIYKPGMTGWAQVNGRDSLKVDQKAFLDSYYYRNHSLFLDLKIIIITIYVVLHRKNVSH
jgi:O-antigen biosynthesis protein WbqP